MALDRLVPISTTPGAVTGNNYMDAVSEEITGLWDRSTITLTSVSGTNTITATATPALTGALGGSMNFILKAAATNTGAVTLNINGGGAVAVVDAEGSALTAGALRINGNYLLHYDSGISKFVVVNYTPAAAVVVGMKLIARCDASASSSIDFFNGASPSGGTNNFGTVVFDSTYDQYLFVLTSVKPATDDVELWLRVGTGAGPTYQSANYAYSSRGSREGGANMDTASTSAAQLVLGTSATGTNAVGNAAGECINVNVRTQNPDDTSLFPTFTYDGAYNEANDSQIVQGQGSGRYAVAGAITAVRFLFESGNIASGGFALYGMTKS